MARSRTFAFAITRARRGGGYTRDFTATGCTADLHLTQHGLRARWHPLVILAGKGYRFWVVARLGRKRSISLLGCTVRVAIAQPGRTDPPFQPDRDGRAAPAVLQLKYRRYVSGLTGEDIDQWPPGSPELNEGFNFLRRCQSARTSTRRRGTVTSFDAVVRIDAPLERPTDHRNGGSPSSFCAHCSL